MREIIQIYKKLGETPLQALDRLRLERQGLRDERMTYLGRLDPMAEGLLLVLVGDTRGKEEYLNLDKVYEFEVLWGVETDTYDTLGLVTSADTDSLALYPQAGSDATRELVSAFATNSISSWLGIRKQSYPPYSSKKISGKQLFEWARAGEKVESPEREIIIYSLEHLGERIIKGDELLQNIVEKISKVRGDFRQEMIIAEWRKNLEDQKDKEFVISKFVVHVSSGTYIRGLVHEMGEKLGSGALVYSIVRTKVGKFSLPL